MPDDDKPISDSSQTKLPTNEIPGDEPGIITKETVGNLPEPVEEKTRKPFYTDSRWLVLISALIVLIIYLPAVQFQFVWDDTIAFRDVPYYRNANMWLSSLFNPLVFSSNYFRPVALLLYVIELHLGNAGPMLVHLTNVLLHFINTALVGLLIHHLTKSSKYTNLLIIAGSAFYGLHPAILEGVAFASCQFDQLMTAFLLCAFLADSSLKAHKVWRPTLVGLTFLLAALSKEMALAFVFALPFWHLATLKIESRESRKGIGQFEGNSLKPSPEISTQTSLRLYLTQFICDNWTVYLAVLIAGLTVIGIRYASLGYILVVGTSSPQVGGTLLQHILLILKSLAVYVILCIWPFTNLTPIHYSVLPIPLGDVSAWLSVGLDILLVVGLVIFVRRYRRPGWLMVAGIITLLPVLNIYPIELGGGAFAAERYLVFPMTLITLAAINLVGDIIPAMTFKPLSITGSLVSVWLIASLVTIQLSLPYWRDGLSLWTWGARRAPASTTPFINLSLEYSNRGQYQIALSFAQKAINMDPKNPEAWDNGGLALFYMSKYPEAQNAFAQAVLLQPRSALFWNNLAGALREQDKLADAEKILLDHALKLDPNLSAAYINLGIVYLRADRPDLASQNLQKALQLLPPNQVADVQDLIKQCQGDLLMQNNDYQGAARAYDQAAAFGASIADAAAGIGSALIALKDYQNAEKILTQALQSSPQDARLYYYLGIVAREKGDVTSARQLFTKATELSPQWNLPQKALSELPQP